MLRSFFLPSITLIHNMNSKSSSNKDRHSERRMIREVANPWERYQVLERFVWPKVVPSPVVQRANSVLGPSATVFASRKVGRDMKFHSIAYESSGLGRLLIFFLHSFSLHFFFSVAFSSSSFRLVNRDLSTHLVKEEPAFKSRNDRKLC